MAITTFLVPHLNIVTRLSVTSRLVPGWVVSGSIGAGPFSVSCCVSGVWQIGDGGRINRTSSLPLNTLFKEYTNVRTRWKLFNMTTMWLSQKTNKNKPQDILPSVFGRVPRYVVKLNFPTNAFFIGLHSDNFACEPLLIDTNFNQKTFICQKQVHR